MIANWNTIVRPDDVVWHLGDFAHRCEPKRMRAVFDRLHGHKHLIIGNHDDATTLQLPWSSPPQQMACITTDGERIVLCHYLPRTR